MQTKERFAKGELSRASAQSVLCLPFEHSQRWCEFFELCDTAGVELCEDIFASELGPTFPGHDVERFARDCLHKRRSS